MTRAILLCLALGASVLSAQQQSLIGTWNLSYPGGMRIENGEATPLMATGVLTVVATGDSLIGDLVTNPTPELPARPPARLAAQLTSGGEVIFVSHAEATLNMNGDEQKATVVSTWRLGVRSDSLVGTVERKLEGFEMGNSGPLLVTGVRAES
ncbi:MAG: hypothetical protein E4H38_08215 [Gemmatimonadales bacterium]|nr:MAG: hypothetical protein E4H38_08215 [Gemmatimonadales bacterium]